MNESTIQQTFCEFLSANGVLFFAPMNETAMMILKMFQVPEKTSYKIISFLKKMGMLPGIPDIVILDKGKTYFIELKAENGKVSSQQQIIHDALRNRGFTVDVAHGLEEAMELCITWGVL